MKEKNYRTNIFAEDKSKMISLYNVGHSMAKISEMINFSPETVKMVIKSETGNYTEIHPDFIKQEKVKPTPRLSEEKLKARVIKLYTEGKDINAIVETIKFVTKSKVIWILVSNKLMDPPVKHHNPPTDAIEKSCVEEFKKQCKVGDKFEIMKDIGFDKVPEVVTITAVYKNFVMTDKGTISYVQLISGKKLEK